MEIKSKPCKILVITDTYVGIPGGSERHLLNFLSNISNNFDAKVIQLNPTGNPYFKDTEYLKDNVSLLSYPLSSFKSFRSLKCIAWTYKQVLSFKPDIVISYHEMADLLNIVVSTLPFTSYKSISSKRDMGMNLHGNTGLLMKVLNKRFSAITAPSKSIIDLVNSEFNGKISKTHVIPNGLCLSDYSQEYLQRDQLKETLGLPKNKKIIITIGWLRPGKGHEYLLKAFSQLKEKNDLCLVLLGKGEDKQRLVGLANEYNISSHVIFAGIQKNVNEWLSVSDVAVSSSLSEGLSNALVEASASQLPIIATNVGGNPEIVEDGVNGYLVDSKSSESLFKALTLLLKDNNKMTAMGKNSREKAEREFSVNKMVSSLESLYLKIQGDSNEQ
jgi:glycosyltransferase involved in cell wall biosynthesis